MVISGGLAISIPYLKNLALLISATTLAGFSFGYLDSGLLFFISFFFFFGSFNLNYLHLLFSNFVK